MAAVTVTDPIIDRFREHRSCNTRDLSAALDGQDVIVRVVSLHDGDTLTAVFEALGGFAHSECAHGDIVEFEAVAGGFFYFHQEIKRHQSFRK